MSHPKGTVFRCLFLSEKFSSSRRCDRIELKFLVRRINVMTLINFHASYDSDDGDGGNEFSGAKNCGRFEAMSD